MKGIQLIYGLSKGSAFNAGSKAVNDAVEIARKAGFERLCCINRSKNRYLRVIKFTIGLTECFLFYKNIFLQYPMSSTPFIDWRLITWFQRLFKKNVTILVHDLHTYRYSGRLSPNETKVLKAASHIIVHSLQMKTLLRDMDIPENHMRVLGAFPYLRSKANSIDRNNCDEIVFAGNLTKSVFLSHLTDFATKKNIKFNLYGSETSHIIYNENLQYKGRFKPEDLSNIKGKWGLVWDGDSLSECSGDLGNYMRINSPHKVSLYIAAELPIIIWRGCALASFILDNNLGIVINTLDDLDEVLGKITSTQYKIMLQNVIEYSRKITSGEILMDKLKY